jgi:hypothetical protein
MSQRYIPGENLCQLLIYYFFRYPFGCAPDTRRSPVYPGGALEISKIAASLSVSRKAGQPALGLLGALPQMKKATWITPSGLSYFGHELL